MPRPPPSSKRSNACAGWQAARERFEAVCGRRPYGVRRCLLKCTSYFVSLRTRPDRTIIRDEWIERAIVAPIREHVQADGRIRRWTQVTEMGGR